MPEQNSDQTPPPVPRYGEYAPSPYGVSGYPGPAQGAPGASAPAFAPAYAPAPRRRRTWDVVLTIILLVLGLLGMSAGLLYSVIISDPAVLAEAMKSQGIDGFSATAGSSPALLAISHVVLFLVAAGLSIALLIRGRVVVFWIPLVAGVVAAVIFWTVLISFFLSDPNFVQTYSR